MLYKYRVLPPRIVIDIALVSLEIFLPEAVVASIVSL